MEEQKIEEVEEKEEEKVEEKVGEIVEERMSEEEVQKMYYLEDLEKLNNDQTFKNGMIYLLDMGYSNFSANKGLLIKYKGNMQEVVEKLIIGDLSASSFV